MNSPPIPALTSDILAVIARLLYRLLPESGDRFGLFYDAAGTGFHLYAVGGSAPGTIAWALPNASSSELASYVITAEAAKVMQKGASTGDGLVSYDGKKYGIRAMFDGRQHIADVVAIP
jgi:hypothetical protein